MLKMNGSAHTRRVNAWWKARNTAVNTAPVPTMKRKSRFNVTVNTLLVCLVKRESGRAPVSSELRLVAFSRKDD